MNVTSTKEQQVVLKLVHTIALAGQLSVIVLIPSHRQRERRVFRAVNQIFICDLKKKNCVAL